MKNNKMNDDNNVTCIVGIGNTLRSDDGAGWHVCALLEEKKMPGVSFITTQQLDTAMLEELVKFNNVIFVDASQEEETISFQLITNQHHLSQPSSHQMNTALLAELAQQLYTAETRFYLCAVGASNFEMGNQLSEKTKHNTAKAVSLVADWITLEHARNR